MATIEQPAPPQTTLPEGYWDGVTRSYIPPAELRIAASLELRERANAAANALAELSAKKREVFVMVALEGVPPEAAAEALGIPIRTVWTRLHHARRELRARLEEDKP